METIVITGANRGIGLALCQAYLETNTRVIATCRDINAADSLNLLTASKNLEVFQLEITSDDSIAQFSNSMGEQPINILVNNAGEMGGERQTLINMDVAAWLETFKVNTIAPFQLASALLMNLKRSPNARIVSLSSQMASLNRRSTGAYAYRSSKAALNKVMQVMACELEADGIIVCPVHPGWVRTDMGGSGADISVDESAPVS